jgi:hypothetical protein
VAFLFGGELSSGLGPSPNSLQSVRQLESTQEQKSEPLGRHNLASPVLKIPANGGRKEHMLA